MILITVAQLHDKSIALTPQSRWRVRFKFSFTTALFRNSGARGGRKLLLERVLL
jgi:hypothetical protein